MNHSLYKLTALGAALLLFNPASSQPFFEKVTERAFGGDPKFPARSVTIGDYDNDGRPDIFLAENRPLLADQHYRIALWHNEGDGRFADRTAAIGADISRNFKGAGANFADFDNDGDLDIFVPVGAFHSNERAANMLLRNDRGTFTDVALQSGLTDVLPTDNAVWLD